MWPEICSALQWKAQLVVLWLLGACIGGGLIKDKWVGQVASETTSFRMYTSSGSLEDSGGGGNGGDVKFLHGSGRGGDGGSKKNNNQQGSYRHQANHYQQHTIRHQRHRAEEFDYEEGMEGTVFLEGEVIPSSSAEAAPPPPPQQQKLTSRKSGGGSSSSSGGSSSGGSMSMGMGSIGGSPTGLDHHLHQKYQNPHNNEEDGEEDFGGSGGIDGGTGGDYTGEQPGSGMEGVGEQQEKLLLQQLMRGYERDVRPVRNASQAVVVQVGITLTQIFDMDEKNQVLTTNVWLDQEWNDELLRWDPKDFGGLEEIRIPCERIWLPDIVLYNNADDYTRGYMPSRAMVHYDGKVFWPPPTKFRSTCGVDVTYFPFDDQTCTLKLGSWTYNGYQVDVTKLKPHVDLDNYVTNGEWDLLRAAIKRNVVYYPCCPEPFPDVTVTLVIRRKTLYYIYNIVLPCMMLSALTLLVFCLPPDSGEKIALGITVLLAFSVFMLAISEALPETSESIPLIGIYLTAVMAITSISVIVTVVVLNLHYLGPRVRPVPTWLKCLLPEDDVNYIRQKSLLIPAVSREPKSGSLKRRFVYIPAASDGDKSRFDHHAASVSATHAPVAEEGITECSSTESVNNERKSPTPNPPPYQDAIIQDSTAPRCRRPRQQQQRTSTTDTSGSTQNASGAGGPSPSGTTATTIAAAAIATAAATQNTPVANTSPTSQTEAMCADLVSAVRYLMSIQAQVESQNVLVAEWRLVAQAVDRILFWIFAFMTIVSSTILLLILPLYKRSTYYGPTQGEMDDETNATDWNNTTSEWNLTTESPLAAY